MAERAPSQSRDGQIPRRLGHEVGPRRQVPQTTLVEGSDALDERLRRLAEARHILLSTFRPDATESRAVVWIVELGGQRLGFGTDALSWKAKRATEFPVVVARPCDRTGRYQRGDQPIVLHAEVVQEGPKAEFIRRRVRAKHPILARTNSVIDAFQRLLGHGSRTRAAMVLSLPPPPPADRTRPTIRPGSAEAAN